MSPGSIRARGLSGMETNVRDRHRLPRSYRALSGDETGADEETLQARRARPGVGVRRTFSSPGGRDNLGPLEAASLLALAQRLRGATETT